MPLKWGTIRSYCVIPFYQVMGSLKMPFVILHYADYLLIKDVFQAKPIGSQ